MPPVAGIAASYSEVHSSHLEGRGGGGERGKGRVGERGGGKKGEGEEGRGRGREEGREGVRVRGDGKEEGGRRGGGESEDKQPFHGQYPGNCHHSNACFQATPPIQLAFQAYLRGEKVIKYSLTHILCIHCSNHTFS